MSGYIGPSPVPQSIQRRQTFTATASQTTFNTSGYTDGDFIDVYLNGVKLVGGTDYTATNGSDIVLTTGAAAGDILDFVTFNSFQLNAPSFDDSLTLQNTTEEDTDGGRESTIIFKGEQSGGEISTLAEIEAAHDGTADDEKGDLIFRTNDGADGSAPTERLRIKSDGHILPSVDNASDLGSTEKRFLDLHLSGGISFDEDPSLVTGSVTAKTLDDYETGYFEPNIQPASGSITWNTDQNKLSYTKIGRIVHVTGQLAVSSVSSPSGITRGSLPFTMLDQDEQSERTTGVVLVQNTSLNVNEFGIYPNGGSDTFLEIVRTNATSVQRDAGSYFNSSTVIQVNYTYVAA
jgi:hypothetical protein